MFTYIIVFKYNFQRQIHKTIVKSPKLIVHVFEKSLMETFYFITH